MNHSNETICAYCLGANQLTSNGKTFTPCELCKGGTIQGDQLYKLNLKYMQSIVPVQETEEFYNIEDNEED